MYALFSKIKFPLFLLIIALLGYFWFLIYAPIYDFADEFFPGRYFMLESIRNGIFPIWIPYQSMGLPMHGDPQAGTFYLPLWILSLFTDYNPYVWGVEYIFHAFVGGLGFYFLLKHFTSIRNFQFIGAVAYMLSGFYVGNVQHIAWIIAATWIPWIIYSIISFYKNPSFKWSFILAVTTSLLFTGGYPGFWIISAYFFIAYTVFWIIKERKYLTKGLVFNTLKYLFIAALATIVLILPALISFIEISQHITRGVGLDYDSQISCSYSPWSFLSLIFPFVTSTEGEFVNNDISMSSIYFGVSLLIFFVIGFFTKKSPLLKFFLGVSIVALLLALGTYLPFHKWVFETVPFINMMRLPSIFRIFIIIPAIIIAINGISFVFSNTKKYQKYFQIVLISLLLLFVLLFFFIDYRFEVATIHEFKTLTWNNLLHKSIHFKFLFQIIIQIGILITIWGVLILKIRQKQHIIFIIIIVDLLINATLCIHKTGYMVERTNKELSQFFEQMPKEYKVPQEVTTSNQIYWKTPYPSLWRNLGIYSKQVEWFSYKGVILKSFETMTIPNQQEGKELYFPKVAFYPEKVIYSENPLPIDTLQAYTQDITMINTYNDTTSYLDLCVFEPGNIFVKTKTNIERPIIICQSYYPGWKAKIETGKKLDIKVLNSSMISVLVPKGEHYLRIYYHRPDIFVAFIIQMIGYLSLLVLSFLIFLHSRKIINFKILYYV